VKEARTNSRTVSLVVVKAARSHRAGVPSFEPFRLPVRDFTRARAWRKPMRSTDFCSPKH
jgi:hypothetical protein